MMPTYFRFVVAFVSKSGLRALVIEDSTFVPLLAEATRVDLRPLARPASFLENSATSSN
jgi:hypothetical protein